MRGSALIMISNYTVVHTTRIYVNIFSNLRKQQNNRTSSLVGVATLTCNLKYVQTNDIAVVC